MVLPIVCPCTVGLKAGICRAKVSPHYFPWVGALVTNGVCLVLPVNEVLSPSEHVRGTLVKQECFRIRSPGTLVQCRACQRNTLGESFESRWLKRALKLSTRSGSSHIAIVNVA